jgi:hypothetical protein
MRPPFKDGGCDNVLPDKGYCTPQERMTDECGIMVERRFEKKTRSENSQSANSSGRVSHDPTQN